MPTYEYSCISDGAIEIVAPMGEAPASVKCDLCGTPARRVFSSPRLSTADPRRMAIIDSTKSTSDKPEVVTSLPTQGRRRKQRMAPPDPRLQKLPRP
jgi:putative FmdB family regulatory protein